LGKNWQKGPNISVDVDCSQETMKYAMSAQNHVDIGILLDACGLIVRTFYHKQILPKAPPAP
jgi:hypothetical protein